MRKAARVADLEGARSVIAEERIEPQRAAERDPQVAAGVEGGVERSAGVAEQREVDAAEVDRPGREAALDQEQLLAVLEVEQVVLVAGDDAAAIAAQVAGHAGARGVDDRHHDVLRRY